jgi:hypothetical protein
MPCVKNASHWTYEFGSFFERRLRKLFNEAQSGIALRRRPMERQLNGQWGVKSISSYWELALPNGNSTVQYGAFAAPLRTQLRTLM